jgi:hypothetical protein
MADSGRRAPGHGRGGNRGRTAGGRGGQRGRGRGRGRGGGGRGRGGGGGRGRGGAGGAQARDRSGPGFVFMCSNVTEPECLRRQLFGLPREQLSAMQTIGCDTQLFLRNFNTDIVHGPFCSVGPARLDIDPTAWTQRRGGAGRATKYPAQVEVIECNTGGNSAVGDFRWEGSRSCRVLPAQLVVRQGKITREVVGQLMQLLRGTEGTSTPGVGPIPTPWQWRDGGRWVDYPLELSKRLEATRLNFDVQLRALGRASGVIQPIVDGTRPLTVSVDSERHVDLLTLTQLVTRDPRRRRRVRRRPGPQGGDSGGRAADGGTWPGGGSAEAQQAAAMAELACSTGYWPEVAARTTAGTSAAQARAPEARARAQARAKAAEVLAGGFRRKDKVIALCKGFQEATGRFGFKKGDEGIVIDACGADMLVVKFSRTGILMKQCVPGEHITTPAAFSEHLEQERSEKERERREAAQRKKKAEAAEAAAAAKAAAKAAKAKAKAKAAEVLAGGFRRGDPVFVLWSWSCHINGRDVGVKVGDRGVVEDGDSETLVVKFPDPLGKVSGLTPGEHVGTGLELQQQIHKQKQRQAAEKKQREAAAAARAAQKLAGGFRRGDPVFVLCEWSYRDVKAKVGDRGVVEDGDSESLVARFPDPLGKVTGVTPGEHVGTELELQQMQKRILEEKKRANEVLAGGLKRDDTVYAVVDRMNELLECVYPQDFWAQGMLEGLQNNRRPVMKGDCGSVEDGDSDQLTVHFNTGASIRGCIPGTHVVTKRVWDKQAAEAQARHQELAAKLLDRLNILKGRGYAAGRSAFAAKVLTRGTDSTVEKGVKGNIVDVKHNDEDSMPQALVDFSPDDRGRKTAQNLLCEIGTDVLSESEWTQRQEQERVENLRLSDETVADLSGPLKGQGSQAADDAIKILLQPWSKAHYGRILLDVWMLAKESGPLRPGADLSTAWTEQTLSNASKTDLVSFLHKWCTPEFLQEHKLNGQVKPIAKKNTLQTLCDAYKMAVFSDASSRFQRLWSLLASGQLGKKRCTFTILTMAGKAVGTLREETLERDLRAFTGICCRQISKEREDGKELDYDDVQFAGFHSLLVIRRYSQAFGCLVGVETVDEGHLPLEQVTREHQISIDLKEHRRLCNYKHADLCDPGGQPQTALQCIVKAICHGYRKESLASSNSDLAFLSYICRLPGVDFSVSDFEGCTALIDAVYYKPPKSKLGRQIEVTQILLQDCSNGVNCTKEMVVNQKCHISKVSHLKSDQTALYFACAAGNLKLVETLLQHGADIQCASRITRETVLHIACADSNRELVEMLLKYGADPNATNKKGKKPQPGGTSKEKKFIRTLLKQAGVENLKRDSSLEATKHQRDKQIPLKSALQSETQANSKLGSSAAEAKTSPQLVNTASTTDVAVEPEPEVSTSPALSREDHIPQLIDSISVVSPSKIAGADEPSADVGDWTDSVAPLGQARAEVEGATKGTAAAIEQSLEPEPESEMMSELEINFHGLPFEFECRKEAANQISRLDATMRKMFLQRMRIAGSAEPGSQTARLWHRLNSTPQGLALYSTSFNKGWRVLWELSPEYSARRSTPDKLQWCDTIRIWSVTNHDAYEAKIPEVIRCYKEGRTCIRQMRKRLRLIGSTSAGSAQTLADCGSHKIHQPRIFELEDDGSNHFSDDEDEAQQDEAAGTTNEPIVCPPADVVDDSRCLVKFYSMNEAFCSLIMRGILSEKLQFPFKTDQLEDSIIHASSNQAMLLIGRSGTGKTTIAMNRMWVKWNAFVQSQTRESQSSPTPLLLPSGSNAWHCVFVTANKVLLTSVRDVFRNMQLGVQHTGVRILPEQVVIPPSLHKSVVTEESFPMFVSAQNWIELLDATICDPTLPEKEAKLAKVTLELDDSIKQAIVITSRLVEIEKDCETEKEMLQQMPMLPSEQSSKVAEVQNRLEMEKAKRRRATEQVQHLRETRDRLQAVVDETPKVFVASDSKATGGGGLMHEQAAGQHGLFNFESLSQDSSASHDPSVDDADSAAQSSRREVTHELFERDFWPRIASDLRQRYSPSTTWVEIVSYIKGSLLSLRTSRGYLSCAEYENMGAKIGNFGNIETRSPNTNRSDIYAIFLLYEEWKNKCGWYDRMERVHDIWRRVQIIGYPENAVKIHSLSIDEVQDFTQAEVCLYLKVADNPNDVLLAGDTCQTIARGVGFRFEDLRSMFHEFMQDDKRIKQVPTLTPLTTNYRTHNGILRAAAEIVGMLQTMFPGSIDTLKKDRGYFQGSPPFIVSSAEDVRELLIGSSEEKSQIEFGAHQVIIVRSEEAKRNLPDFLQRAIKLTVFQAKGLEFDDVFLYDLRDISIMIGNLD